MDHTFGIRLPGCYRVAANQKYNDDMVIYHHDTILELA